VPKVMRLDLVVGLRTSDIDYSLVLAMISSLTSSIEIYKLINSYCLGIRKLLKGDQVLI
jgi:hypothetical protein